MPSRSCLSPLCLAALLLAPLRLVAADFASTVTDATFKLFHPDSTSTCLIVRRPEPDQTLYLVTTAHTLEKTKGRTAIVVLRQPKPDGSYERKDHTIPIRADKEPLWVRHPTQDVAVLRLADPTPVPVAALRVEVLADETRLTREGMHIGSPLLVLTYPQRFEANSAGFPVARQGIFASPPQLPVAVYPTLLADFTTFAGDSGGPVFFENKDGAPVLVGIVINQHHHEDRIKSEYEERTIRHPLGMGTVLHATFIRATVEAAAKVP